MIEQEVTIDLPDGSTPPEIDSIDSTHGTVKTTGGITHPIVGQDQTEGEWTADAAE